MSNNVEVSSRGGVSFAGLLTLVFVTLKLIGEISWSWWWVLSPIWISWAVVFGFLLFGLVFVLLFARD